jgi:alpha-L-arabinofuranosidase
MKKSILVAMTLCLCIAVQAQSKLTVNADQGKDLISKHIYGHFSEHLGHCIYGGGFADEYHYPVNVKDFNNAKLSGGKLNISLPAKSVVLLEIE